MSQWYFAYGANTSRAVFVERRGMRPTHSEAARLGDHRLAFDMPGVPGLEPAFANVHPAPGERVLGVLHQVAPAELARLDRMEAAGTSYRLVETTVVGVGAGPVRARLYRAIAPLRGLRPSRRYVDLLVAGAREFGHPEAWVAALEAQRPASSALRDRLAPGIVRGLEVLMARGVPVDRVLGYLRERWLDRRRGAER